MSHKEQYIQFQHILPVFFKSWWLEAVCDGDWDVAMDIIEDRIIAVWPYQTEKKWWFHLVRTPRLTPYLGPFFIDKPQDATSQQQSINRLWQQIPKADLVQWTCLPNTSWDGIGSVNNLSRIARRTYLLALDRSEESLWSGVHFKRKNAIRKAQQDLIIRPAPIDWSLFTQHHRLAFEQKATHYPYQEQHFRSLDTILVQNKASLSMQAVGKSGEIHAQALFVVDNSTMYYLLSATSAHPHRGAVAEMIWQAILEAKKRGLSYFDFEGSMDDGIAHFYKRFGAEETKYHYFEQCNSALWTLKKRFFS